MYPGPDVEAKSPPLKAVWLHLTDGNQLIQIRAISRIQNTMYIIIYIERLYIVDYHYGRKSQIPFTFVINMHKTSPISFV